MCFGVIRAQKNNHCSGKLNTHTNTHRSWTDEDRPPSTDRQEKIDSTLCFTGHRHNKNTHLNKGGLKKRTLGAQLKYNYFLKKQCHSVLV